MSKRDGAQPQLMRVFITIFAIVCNLLLADAITKELAVAHLKSGAAISLLPIFNLSYVENRGCAWGLLQNHVWLLAVIGIFAMSLIIYSRKDLFATTTKGSRWWIGRISECLLYAGILGNLIDRVCRGYVIDFLDFHWELWHFPCFNLADIYITLAAIGIISLSLFQKKRND